MRKSTAQKSDATLFGEIQSPEPVQYGGKPAEVTATGKIIDAKPKPKPKPAPKPKAKTKPAPKAGTAVAVHQPKPAVVTEPAPTNMLAVIARAAADPAVVPEKMRALLDMQKEIMAEEARLAFSAAYLEMQNELPTINAKGRIEIREKVGGERTGKIQQSTPYATFNEIHRVTKPVLKKHGFTLSFATDQSPDGSRLIVRGFLDHIKGHQRTTLLALPLETSGSKNNVQGYGSSMSYGKRYAAIALLNLVTEALEDRDDDGVASGKTDLESVQPGERKGLTVEQSAALVALINSSGAGLERFLDKYQIKAVIDLDPALYDSAVAACKNFEAEAKKRGQR